jgi:periplasmic divalent cation tolerance protein
MRHERRRDSGDLEHVSVAVRGRGLQIDGPVASIYRWRQAVEQAEEWRLTCKTAPSAEAACVAAIQATHDYELPQVTIASVTATPGYAAWVRESLHDA